MIQSPEIYARNLTQLEVLVLLTTVVRANTDDFTHSAKGHKFNVKKIYTEQRKLFQVNETNEHVVILIRFNHQYCRSDRSVPWGSLGSTGSPAVPSFSVSL